MSTKLVSLENEMRALWATGKCIPKYCQTKTGFNGTKNYILAMFPYPSGTLHMGHVRVYTISDTLARFSRMLGIKTLHPMGWDAFGLPAENAARERGLDAREWTLSNIDTMHHQMKLLALGFDNFETSTSGIKTCDPDYYRWTQWIFLRLLKRGLAYRKNGMVNWDPVDETVLADEQVDHSGRSWRSGVVVERRPLVQWYLRITAYIPEMLDVLKCSVSDPSSDLARWPSGIREMQRNWILGSAADKLQDNMKSLDRSKNFDHEIELEQKNLNLNIEKSINRPVTSLDGLLNDESKSETNHWPKVKDTRNLVDSRGFKSVDRHQNHENGAIQTDFLANKTDEKSASFKSEHWKIRDWLISRQRRWGTPIPIIHCKGCGIIPVKEEDLPVTLEMQSEPITRCPSCGKIDDVQRDPDTMDTFVDSSWYYLRLADPNNRDLPISIESLRENLPVDTYIGGSEHAVMHLLYARFIYRFMIDEISGKFDRLNQFHRFYDSDLVKQANNDLANCLPDTIRAHSNELMPNEILKNDLKFSINYFADGKAFDLNNSKLDTSCGEHYSSRHTSEPLSSQNILNEEKERFSLNKIAKEPFKKLLVQGIVEAETFKCLKTGRYLRVEDAHKHEHTRQWEKMSKSKGNGVDPVHLINVYGADSLRLLILFKAPPGIGIQWRECDIAGPSRWLMRVVALVDKICAQRKCLKNLSTVDGSEKYQAPNRVELVQDTNLRQNIKEAIEKAFKSYSNPEKLNTVLPHLMTFTRHLEAFSKTEGVTLEDLRIGCYLLGQLMHPMAPHTSGFICRRLLDDADPIFAWPALRSN